MKSKTKSTEQRLPLTLTFSFIFFGAFIAALAISAVVTGILTKYDLFTGVDGTPSTSAIIAFMGGVSFILGATAALLVSKMPFRPINSLVDVANRLANGDYATRIRFKGMLSGHNTLRQIEESVNTLARELESTELLRADFINNFSHEFKTPIVSIAGLAKVINRGGITDQERATYMKVIEDESVRLSDMATNVLNLTRVENQEILSELTQFNVSEQIRDCLLLAESKWARKNIDLHLDFDEHGIRANEELLKQVWINLIENAIKFSKNGDTVSISIHREEGELVFTFSNPCEKISEEDKKHIFKKFYQLDASHHTQGNGIGLAIVKRIIELHRGRIAVSWEGGIISFTVTLRAQ